MYKRSSNPSGTRYEFTLFRFKLTATFEAVLFFSFLAPPVYFIIFYRRRVNRFRVSVAVRAKIYARALARTPARARVCVCVCVRI